VRQRRRKHPRASWQEAMTQDLSGYIENEKNIKKPGCLKISHKKIWLNQWMKNNGKMEPSKRKFIRDYFVMKTELRT
jgi:hypothetical protein